MSDNGKHADAEMAKAIFISADCWLGVFDLLPPSQLGLGIAMISHRFQHLHNGTKQMEIVNSKGKAMPIPQIDVPSKVSGFECIIINYIDGTVIAFLLHFRQLFAACQINLSIVTLTFSALELFFPAIWPMIVKNICGMEFTTSVFELLRRSEPSFLNACSSLCLVSFTFDDFSIEFPADDGAMASDGQAVVKWLFTLRPDGVPKVLKCSSEWGHVFKKKITEFKAAFKASSSPANFIVVISFPSHSDHSVVSAFGLTNELTQERLTLTWMNDIGRFLLIRCPILRDTNKWAKWEKEAIGWQFQDQWNKIIIQINDDEIVDEHYGNPGSNDDHRECECEKK
ncbi:hypothetical protein niasHT_032922 [Heterodera trifolii]|uniref:Uncharacterized protein n=1 Tax=Heterodera trifolii TaxID=157864 RepID=A0ABD2ILC4_9BILA